MAQSEFWASPGMEPKRIYRWVMRFNSTVATIDEWLVKKVSRPSWSISESKHNFLNHTFYYPGRIEYDEISVQLVDAITPNAAVNMQNLLARAGYLTPDNAAEGVGRGYTTISKAGWGAAGAGLGGVQIVQLDQFGDPLETWSLKNTWIKSCKLNELDYESDDMLNIDLTLRYDYFKFDVSGGGNRIGPGINIDEIAATWRQ